MYLIYNLVVFLAAALLSPWWVYRAWRGRLPGLAQRLGFLPKDGSWGERPAIWVHAVSLGEVKSAATFLEELRKRIPAIRAVLTSSTRTGWEAARQLLPPEDCVLFPPLDFPWVCRRFLRQINPKVVLIFETELWPNLFRETKRYGAALLLMNGRISDRAFRRYRVTRFLWRRVLMLPDTFFAQSADHAERFIALGAPAERVRVAGNLKFASRPAPSPIVYTLGAVAQEAQAEPVIVAGSTMPGEEKYLLAAYLALRQEVPRLWMILAPRHPERFRAVEEEVRALGIPLQRRSQLRPSSGLSVPGILLLDSMGELGAIYQFATVAFVGGTLVPTGGHNILEPAFFARPIVIGPSMGNFQEIADAFLHDAGSGPLPDEPNIRTGAIIQVQNAQELIAALRSLFRQPDFSRRLGESAHRVLKQRVSSIAPVLAEVERYLDLEASAAGQRANLARPATVGAEKTT